MDQKLLEFEENFSVLDRYGTDVTKEEYVTNPAIGRDKQIKELILILLTPEKSAILIGKPGIGKTAIVEGLAYRIQKDDVPDALKGYTIINIKTASLLGTMPSGESKVQKMIDELKTREKVILFVDEIHMLIGATDTSSLDFANIFKEGLGRGSIKVIGATTTEEYERYILRDKAFTRRFQKVDVPEPTQEETVEIMMGTLPKFEKQTGKKMKYSPFIQKRIMTFLVDITSEYKRVYALGSRYPDVSLTLLKQAFSYTVYDDREYMDIFDVRKAIEDTKNIYPDVKKKELPRFNKEFEDIIQEEKGEKEIEPWRLDRNQSTTVDSSEEVEEVNPEVLVESYDQMIEEQKKAQEVIGRTKPREENLTRRKAKKDSKALDDLLLSNEVEVVKDDKYGVSVPNQTVKIHKELKKSGVDDILLSGTIGSILDSNEVIEDIQTYKTNDKVNDKLLSEESKNIIINEKPKVAKKKILYDEDDEELKPVKEPMPKLSSEYVEQPEVKKKPPKIEIDMSKYLHRPDITHEDDNKKKLMAPKNEVVEEKVDTKTNNSIEVVEEKKENINTEVTKEEPAPVKDNKSIQNNKIETDALLDEISKYLNEKDFTMPIDKGKKNDNKENTEKKKEEKDNKGDESMYGQNYGGNIDFLMGNGNPGYPPNDNNPYNQPPMGGPNQMNGYGQNMPFNNQMPNQFQPMNDFNQGPGFPNQQSSGNSFFPGDMSPEPQKQNDSRETLFGVPMYDETKEKEMNGGNNLNQMMNPGFNQMPQGMNDPFNKPNDSFFGAPMYSDSPKGDVFSKDNDIFGQLLLPENNMRIQGGKIVDDFSDINVPPGGKMIIGDISTPGMNQQGPGFGMPQNNFGPDPQGAFGMPQNNFGPDPQGGFGMPQNNFGPDPQGGFGMPQNNYGPDPQGGFGMPQNNFGPDPQSGFGMPQNNYGPDPQGGFGMPQNNFGPDPQGGFGMPQNNFGQMPNQGFGMPQNNFGQMPNQGFGMPQGNFNQPQGYGNQMMPQNQMGGGMYNPYAMPRGPVFNELKVENNLLKKPAEIEKEKEEELEEERKAKEALEKAKAEEDAFVNYNDLKNGKVDQKDLSKYVSQNDSKPVPRVDLNLENNSDEEKDYEE